MKADSGPLNDNGGRANVSNQLRPEPRAPELPTSSGGEGKVPSDCPQKKPYFILSNFRPLKQANNLKPQENTSPLILPLQTFQKATTEPKQSQADLNNLTCSPNLMSYKTHFDTKTQFKGSLESETKEPACRMCRKTVQGPGLGDLCNNCSDLFIWETHHKTDRDFRVKLQLGTLGPKDDTALDTYMVEESPLMTKIEPDHKFEKMAQKSTGFNHFTVDRSRLVQKEPRKDQRSEAQLCVTTQCFRNDKEQRPQTKRESIQARKSKYLYPTELPTLKNLPITSSTMKISINQPISDKKMPTGTLSNARNSPKTLGRIQETVVLAPTCNALEPQGNPNSKKSIKPQTMVPQSKGPLEEPRLSSNGESPMETPNPMILKSHPTVQAPKKPSPTLCNALLKPLPNFPQPAKIAKPSSRSSSSDKSLHDKCKDSNTGRSDEQLCRAFSVDRSLTITAKASSLRMSESMETDPEVERSMRYEENRTLSFLNEDDEIFDKVQPPTLPPPRKNKLKLTSTKFLVGKKHSECEEQPPAPSTPLLNVISNQSYPYYGSSVFVNLSANLSHNETSMFSTQDSRPGQNKSLNYEPVSDGKHNAPLPFAPVPRPFYGVFPAKLDPRFIRDKAPLPSQIASSGFEHLHENFTLAQFELGQNLSMISLPSAEDELQKKARTRKCQPVTDGKEFGIVVDCIFDVCKTTLMIKNIPNRYTKEMMLETIDKKFKDTYNFFYLPIDFDNNCNVGYAFINFIDLAPIRDFFLEFNGSHWPNFKSDKICEITYARIQGKEACIQHFKNSSLMKQEVS